MVRRLTGYGVAIAGAAAVTGAIALVTARFQVPGLSAFYLLLVLWLGATWGRGPAVAGSVAAFLFYDFFLVPPVGTFAVRGPSELLERLGRRLCVKRRRGARTSSCSTSACPAWTDSRRWRRCDPRRARR